MTSSVFFNKLTPLLSELSDKNTKNFQNLIFTLYQMITKLQERLYWAIVNGKRTVGSIKELTISPNQDPLGTQTNPFV